jgi:hypothetical protein
MRGRSVEVDLTMTCKFSRLRRVVRRLGVHGDGGGGGGGGGGIGGGSDGSGNTSGGSCISTGISSSGWSTVSSSS